MSVKSCSRGRREHLQPSFYRYTHLHLPFEESQLSHREERRQKWWCWGEEEEVLEGAGLPVQSYNIPDSAKVSRIIRHFRCDALLVGVGGCGKQSLTCFAAVIAR